MPDVRARFKEAHVIRFQILRRYATVAALGLLLACGGGDSSVTLTEANAQMIASQGINTMDMLEGMAQTFDQFDDVIENQNALQVLCTSGNVSQTINDVEPLNQVSTGDSIYFRFNGCTIEDQGSSVTFDGGISVVIDEVTGTPGAAFTRRITFRFDSLTLSFDGASVTLNGGFTVEGSSTDGTDLRAVISGDAFSAFARFGSQSQSIRFYNFNLDRSVDAAGDYSISYHAEVSSSEFGGTVTFETVTPFTGNGDAYPSLGQLVMTGDGGGMLVFTALNSTDVEILVFSDATAQTPDATILTTWDLLQQ